MSSLNSRTNLAALTPDTLVPRRTPVAEIGRRAVYVTDFETGGGTNSTTIDSTFSLTMTAEEVARGDFWLGLVFAHRSNGGDDLTIDAELSHAAFTGTETAFFVSTVPAFDLSSGDLAFYITDPIFAIENVGAPTPLTADIARDYRVFFYKFKGADPDSLSTYRTESTGTVFAVDWTSDPDLSGRSGSSTFQVLLTDGATGGSGTVSVTPTNDFSWTPVTGTVGSTGQAYVLNTPAVDSSGTESSVDIITDTSITISTSLTGMTYAFFLTP